MRSLESFLLEEVMLHESVEVPDEFTKIELRGGITNQIKDLLNISSASEMNFKNENLKITKKEGKEEIRNDLKLGTTKDFMSIFKKIAAAEKLDPIFTGATEVYKKDSVEGIKLALKNGFEQVGGKRPSTLKFIKFWCSCACIACGIPEKEVASYKYFQDTINNVLLIIK